jgi:acetyl esterase/lipase
MCPRLPALLLTIAASLASLAAEEQKPTRLPAGVRVERDVPYVPGGDPAQRLDLYLPERAGGPPLPLLLCIHGGGWSSGSKDDCPAALLVPHGYAAASIDYRLVQQAAFPAQIQDCQAALRWLRANSGKYNLDPDRVCAWGASAGGHLAALMGTAGGTDAFPKIGGHEAQSDRVQAVCNVYGPTNLNSVARHAAEDTAVRYVFDFADRTNPYARLIGGRLGEDHAKAAAASPIHYVGRGDPPFLILHGTADPIVPFAQSVEFAEALRKAGVDVTLQGLPGAGHGGDAFGLRPVRELVLAFFAKHLKGADVKIEPLPDSAVTPPTAPAAK